MNALRDFKAFILRGNVVDLAVGVVIGVAFGAIVTINKSKFLYGDFINAVISFLIIAAVVFFLAVRPVNWLMARRKSELPPDPTTRDCPYCLSTIPVKVTRCAFCTAEVPGANA